MYEAFWVASEVDRFSCRFYTIRNQVYTRRCEKDQVTCSVLSEHSVGKPFAPEESIITEAGRRHVLGSALTLTGF
jgi:hypothetical protein